ncbi:MAG: hypothetical protein LQ340_007367 [Diploschistes diacapsis]|nr:MAG: hypothetical protein LQ340_007367 [Diploschistes diacapsis]
MPRPQRSKIAPSAPAALPAKLLAALAADRADPTSSSSDDSQGLVKRNATGKNRRGAAKKEVFMTGALPGREQNEAGRNKPPSRTSRAALVEITRNADFARKREREMRAAKVKEGLEVDESREEDVDVIVPSSLPGADGTASEPVQTIEFDAPTTAQKPVAPRSAMPSANWRAQATPRMGMDSSVLALGNFKRRSRQPSLLGIGRPDESVSMSSFDLGRDISFGELEAEKSSLVTPVQRTGKQLSDAVGPEDMLGSASRKEAALSSSSRKRKRSKPEILVRRSQSPTTSEADRIFGSEGGSPPSTAEVEHEGEGEGEDKDQDEPELPALPKPTAATPPEVWSDTMAPPQSSSPSRSIRTQSQPEANDKANSTKKIHQSRRADLKSPSMDRKPTKPPKTRDQSSKPKPLQPLSTATLQALLPRRPNKKRHGKQDEFDVPSNSDHELEMTAPQDDEDELSFMPVAKRKKRDKGTGKGSGSGKEKGKGKRSTVITSAKSAGKTPKSNAKRGSNIKAKAKAASKASAAKTPLSKKTQPGTGTAITPSASSETRRTYSRRQHPPALGTGDASSSALSPPPSSPSLSHDHNSEVETSASSSSTPRANGLSKEGKEEMKALARKFAEVDEWEMEFESVEGSGSSFAGAR